MYLGELRGHMGGGLDNYHATTTTNTQQKPGRAHEIKKLLPYRGERGALAGPEQPTEHGPLPPGPAARKKSARPEHEVAAHAGAARCHGSRHHVRIAAPARRAAPGPTAAAAARGEGGGGSEGRIVATGSPVAGSNALAPSGPHELAENVKGYHLGAAHDLTGGNYNSRRVDQSA